MYSRGKRFFIMLSMLVILFTVIGGIVGKAVKKDEVYRDLTNFSEVLTLVERSYVESVDPVNIFSGAMEGLADSLASDACYLTAAQYEKYHRGVEDNGHHIGIHISERMGYFIVIAPWDESAAAKGGLLAGDFIKAINQIPSEKINIFEAEEIFKSKEKDITLDVYREGLRKSLTFTFRTEKYTPPKPQVKMLDEGRRLAYLRIPALDGIAAGEIADALKQVQSMKASRLILDLRNLSGEDLENTAAVADLFLEAGTIVTLKSRKYPEKRYQAVENIYYPLPPMNILINRGTAGGGEVLAAALSENGKGTLTGEKSFGFGTTREFLRLSNGSAIYLPVIKYVTPDQNDIDKDGLAPEWTIERSDFVDDMETITSKELLELELEKILEQIVATEEQEKAA